MSAKRMTSIADVVPVAVARITGEPIRVPTNDRDVSFLRACSAQVRTQDIRVSLRLESIAERLERAIAAGQLIAVTEAAD